jgi:multidrug efflux pump subunit AcrB
MIAILLQRPIAVLLSCTLAVVAGVVSLQHLPVSLLPDTEAPRITVQVRLPRKPAEAVEHSALGPLREALARTADLKHIRSLVSDGQGFIYLGFEYGTDMDMACLEVNERIDRALAYLPREMPRPLVVRSNVSDIPIFELQVVSKGDVDITAISTLVERVIRRKLEQLPGVSLVDVNGLHKSHILLRPKRELMHALGISEGQVVHALRNAYQEYGTFSIKNGHYQYFLRFENMADSLHRMGELPVLGGSGRALPLSTLATTEAAAISSEGYHLYNGKKSLGIQICKQSDARMDEVAPQIRTAVEEMRRAHPQADFILTRDQSYLLNASIHNLYQVIGYGALLSTGILFLFLGNFTAGLMVGLSIPVSLLITLALFRFCGLSMNILSLSGLALGVGMLIDHSIIVLDAISRKAGDGLGLLEAGVKGTGEVLAPVLGQMLTSVAVYGPLILLPGISGALVYEQALALSLCLAVSLLVAFILVPLLCRILLASSLGQGASETRFFLWLQQKYHHYIKAITLRKTSFMVLAALFILSGVWVAYRIPVEGLPAIERKETLLEIDWREPLTVEENLRRVLVLDSVLAPVSDNRTAEVGALQYVLSVEGQMAREAQMYYTCASSKGRTALDKRAEAWIKGNFPLASFRFEAPPNALNQIFPSDGPFFEVRIRARERDGGSWSFHQIYHALADFPLKGFQTGKEVEAEEGILLNFDQERMAVYRMTRETLLSKLGTLLGGGVEIEAFGQAGPLLRIHAEEGSLSSILREGIRTPAGGMVPLSHFIRYSGGEMPGQIAADQSGPYYSLELDAHIARHEASKDKIHQWADKHGLEVRFSGAYFETGHNLYTLAKIGAIVLLLLYFILALQFDHLLLPLVIMSALAFGTSGAVWLLYLSGASLNIMSGIGFVIVFGIILDDPILKVEVIQQQRALFEAQGMATDEALKKAIGVAGSTCLKPMLMTTLTTCLSLVPVFFSPGIGSELQRPLALVVIGGLAVGTFFTSWCIPLIYVVVMRGASAVQK